VRVEGGGGGGGGGVVWGVGGGGAVTHGRERRGPSGRSGLLGPGAGGKTETTDLGDGWAASERQ
jgi:hypothetical protein